MRVTQYCPLKGSGGQIQTPWSVAGLKAEPPHSRGRDQGPLAQHTLEQFTTVSGTESMN